MIQFEGEFGARVLHKLQTGLVIWLTTVSADGTPQPNPVWFHWDGERCLVFSRPDSARIRNITRNPRVSFHFEGATVDGGEVVVLTGLASLEPQAPSIPQEFIDKYWQVIQESWHTPEQLLSEYSVAIHITPEKYRGF